MNKIYLKLQVFNAYTNVCKMYNYIQISIDFSRLELKSFLFGQRIVILVLPRETI